LQLPVDAIGVDLIQTHVKALGAGWDIGAGRGVVNGGVRSSNRRRTWSRSLAISPKR